MAIDDYEAGRPKSLEIKAKTVCCGASVLVQCGGVYRCPCGKRQERLATSELRARLMRTAALDNAPRRV